MFDFTKEISLEPRSRMKYNIARLILYAAFLFGVIFVIYLILFPTMHFTYSFNSPNSSSNNIISPRTASDSGTPAKNPIAGDDKLMFNANPIGKFSKASVTFSTDSGSTDINGISVKFRKSYQAFFYPIGQPLGFRDGTLLTTDDGSYFMVSDGMLRRFSNTDIILKLGYSKSAFLQVLKDDLQYNEVGADIADSNNYPDNTFFAIGDTYYELKGQQLFPFVTTNAFFSQYDAIQAIIKSNDFLNSYKVSETVLGYADGTLASNGISAYILSRGKSYPIDNPTTFLSMGFDFNNVVAIDGEELGVYERQKQFTNNQPHPDGTLFFDQKTKEYSVIENGIRRPIRSAAVAKTYSKQKPVLADSQESEKSVSCNLQETSASSGTYTCSALVDLIDSLIGNDFQIEVKFSDNTAVRDINMTFSTSLTWENVLVSLSKIKTRLITNYTSQ